MTYETDIYYAIKSQNIDSVIQDFIDTANEQLTVDQWKLDNYAKLRKWDYPEYAEYLDAIVKLNSTDLSIRAEGQVQLDKYIADCLNVKIRFPKP
jgi:hypothetical protein